MRVAALERLRTTELEARISIKVLQLPPLPPRKSLILLLPARSSEARGWGKRAWLYSVG